MNEKQTWLFIARWFDTAQDLRLTQQELPNGDYFIGICMCDLLMELWQRDLITPTANANIESKIDQAVINAHRTTSAFLYPINEEGNRQRVQFAKYHAEQIK